MSKGIIIHLDDREQRLTESKNYFEQSDLHIDFELITINDLYTFNQRIEEEKQNLKCIILDLWGDISTRGEIGEGEAKFVHIIKQSYADMNVPIFIYTGHPEKVPAELRNRGTVFTIDKDQGINVIYDKIQIFHESGFLEVFCTGGILERQLQHDLHEAFTRQFKNGNDLIKTIESIKRAAQPEQYASRTKRIFKRIAMRSLLSNLISPETSSNGEIIEEYVSSTEHYIVRINSIDIWTGDIFKKKESEDYVYILTPRCNVIRNNNILYCPFILGDKKVNKKNVSKMCQGDPTVSGYNRILPPSANFEGGKLNISRFNITTRQDIIQNYDLIISTSEELTNEILGKFGAYFFRTGITPWDTKEIETLVE